MLVLAHPLTEPGNGIAVAPVVLAMLGIGVTIGVGLIAARQFPAGGRVAAADLPERRGTETSVGGLVGLVVLLAMVIAGLVGDDDELRNIAPSVVIGLGWPLLLMLSISVGRVWSAVDPFAVVARIPGRVIGTPSRDEVAPTLWPATIVAAGWMGYLVVLPRPLDPRTVGAATAAYLLVGVASTAAMGLERWLATGEFFGILARLLSLVPRARTDHWIPQRGTLELLAVVVGGGLVGLWQASSLWPVTGGLRSVALVAILSCTLVVVAARGAAVWARRLNATGDVSVALLPLAAAVGLAFALVDDRLLTSAQLAIQLAPTPLGGQAEIVLDVLGPLGRNLLQVALLVVGGVWSFRLVGLRRSVTSPVRVVVGAVVGLGILAVTGV